MSENAEFEGKGAAYARVSTKEQAQLSVSHQKRAAIYARTATVQELGPNWAMASQIYDCTEYAHQKGYKVEYAFEEVWNGHDIERPILTQLLEAAERGEFDILLITNYDRLTRTMVKLLQIISEFENSNVKIESVHNPLEEPAWELMTTVIASLEVIERQRVAERIRHGKQARKDEER